MTINNVTAAEEKRFAPRFPIPKEEIRFHINDARRAFAIRDLSMTGLAIGLLEHGEMLLFPEESKCLADMRLGTNESITVELEVVRVSAHAIGFRFCNLDKSVLTLLDDFLNPIAWGHSLRPVNLSIAPKAMAEGITKWFHGDNSTDLYLWQDEKGGVNKLLLCLGNSFLQWSEAGAVQTGTYLHIEADNANFQYDQNNNQRIISLARKVLENADILDYRLVDFIKRQL